LTKPCYIQAYITPPFNAAAAVNAAFDEGGQAVNSHNDDRDVVVIQLYGAKNWVAYNNTCNVDNGIKQLPSYKYQVGKGDLGKGALGVPEVYNDLSKDNDDRHVIKLNTNDKLYIPRGGVHWAKTSKDYTSVHLTVACPSSYASARYGLSELIRLGVTLGGEALMDGFGDTFEGGDSDCMGDSKKEEECVEEFNDYLKKTVFNVANVKKVIDDTKASVLINRDKSRKTWEEEFMAYNHAHDRGGWCLWESNIKWLGGVKNDDSNNGELEVCDTIENDVLAIVGKLREGYVGSVESLKREWYEKEDGLDGVLDDLAFLVLCRVLVQLGAVEVAEE
jgi:hypothetical protein